MALRGEAGWDAAMVDEFGPDRWPLLRGALQREVEHVCFLNPFLPSDAHKSLEEDYALRPTNILGAFAFDVPEDVGSRLRVQEYEDDSVIFVDAAGGGAVALQDPPSAPMPPFFFAEGAGVIAALALRAAEGERVLDACAAPGGQSLVLASSMFAKGLSDGRAPLGLLVCNEASKPKAARTQQAIREFLPRFCFDESLPHGPRVVFTAADLGTPVNSLERFAPYDKILVETPGMADREKLRGKGGGMERWSFGAIKVSAERQGKLLKNALWLLKEGGVLQFCNRSLAIAECDEVVEQLIVQMRDTFELRVLQVEDDICRMAMNCSVENTAYGVRILPDVALFGPVFFSRIQLVRRRHPDVAHLSDAR